MDQELEMIANRLTQAKMPEEVFGNIQAQRDEMFLLLQKNYRAIAKIAHPDMYHTKPEQILAQTTFQLLTDWLGKANEKIRQVRDAPRPKTVAAVVASYLHALAQVDPKKKAPRVLSSPRLKRC